MCDTWPLRKRENGSGYSSERRRRANLLLSVSAAPSRPSSLSEDEYARLRQIEDEAARMRFKEALEAIGAEVQAKKISRKAAEEAIRAARRR